MTSRWAPLPIDLDIASRRLVEELRRLKDSRSLTLAVLSAKTHYSTSSWERWLNGRRMITRPALEAIAEVTGAESERLLTMRDHAVRATSDQPHTATSATAGDIDQLGHRASPVPRQLPRDPADFVGRERELDALVDGLCDAGRDALPVWAVVGMGGLGKTSLAVRAAHRAAPFFPDGTIFLDLGGGSAEPVTVDVALRRLLNSVGVTDQSIPADTDERAALLRSILVNQRVLIVLDNASNAAQIRPLLPGGLGCAALVTSRNQLAGLEGVSRIALEVLPDTEATLLLTRVSGAERFTSEPDAAREVLSVCAGLPLALRITGSKLAVRSTWSLRTLTQRLQSAARALDELAVDDLAVRTCFEASYDSLVIDNVELGEARSLKLLGLWDGSEISLTAAATLLDMEPTEAERDLERLTDISLLESPQPGRYRFHNLLHSFAAERAHQELSTSDRRAAIARLAGWYLHTAASASEVIYEGRGTYDLTGIARPTCARTFTSRKEAMDWFESESASLVPITRQARAWHLDAIAALLPQTFRSFLEIRLKFEDWLDTATIGVKSAERIEARSSQAQLEITLATAHAQVGNYPESMRYARRSMDLFEQLGDGLNHGRAMDRLGQALYWSGDSDQACKWLGRAIEAFEAHDYPYGVAAVHNQLGVLYNDIGLAQEAIGHLERCRELSRKLGSAGGEAAAIANLGQSYRILGRHEDALAAYAASNEIFSALGHRPGMATNLVMIGGLYRDTGRIDEARECLGTAVAMLEELRHRSAAQARRSLEELAAG